MIIQTVGRDIHCAQTCSCDSWIWRIGFWWFCILKKVGKKFDKHYIHIIYIICSNGRTPYLQGYWPLAPFHNAFWDILSPLCRDFNFHYTFQHPCETVNKLQSLNTHWHTHAHTLEFLYDELSQIHTHLLTPHHFLMWAQPDISQ